MNPITNSTDKYVTMIKKIPRGDKPQSMSQNEASVCVTEVDHHVNKVNPMQLADKTWMDPYKLDKLIKQQQKNFHHNLFGMNCDCENFGYGASHECRLHGKI